MRKALDRYFRAMRREPRPVEWVPDLESGYRAVAEAARDPEFARLCDADCRAADHAGHAVAWRTHAGGRAVEEESGIGWSAAEAIVASVAGERAGRSASAHLWHGPRSAGLTAAHSVSLRSKAPWWSAFVHAFESGLWVYWLLHNKVVAVPPPEIKIANGRIHSPDGPAVVWHGGARYHFWRGVSVPQRVVEDPCSITARDITREPNVEVRRVMLERHGAARYLCEVGARPDFTDEFGALYRTDMAGDEPLVMVKVLNSTPEPDGAHREYYLRVPPSTLSPREAVAWTFGLGPGGYAPSMET